MQAGRRLLMRHPRLGLVILALVLGLRVLIPPGMMPVADRAGGLVVTLCDGSGPATIRTITLATKPGKGSDSNRANPGPCAFGVLAEALLGGGEPPALPGPAPLVGLIAPALAAALALAAIARTRPPARAPPVARFAPLRPTA
ncbi:hypothetical protein GCM10019060_06250 [Novosphingobium pokkalii]|nr:hypothetical protein GCM10019060_06250 [Novosphingobium pokkalii]